MSNTSDFRESKERMMRLLRGRIDDERVLTAMDTVPRERFVPPELESRAYDDRALPIGEGQTISQPFIVAAMVAALDLRGDERVLEVGTGSGYQAAVLAHLAREVVTVERVASLTAQARARLAALGHRNVSVIDAQDQLGDAARAPYDAIIVAAASPHVPRALIDQLSARGRIVVPIGTRREQELVRARKTAHGLELVRLGPCRFVPLIGRGAWSDASEDAEIAARIVPT